MQNSDSMRVNSVKTILMLQAKYEYNFINFRLIRESPPQNSSVSTNTDDVSIIWTDPNSVYVSTVSKSHMCHFSFIIFPYLQKSKSYPLIFQSPITPNRNIWIAKISAGWFSYIVKVSISLIMS